VSERIAPGQGEQNILKEKLLALCPEIFQDGKLSVEALQTLLPDELEDEGQQREHFGLNWPGKMQARQLALRKPVGSTLAPCPGDGINEETTQNVFIEGDNLEVLKLLREAYSDQVKMIYIDPPYNTGRDMIYKDKFKESNADYLSKTGQQAGQTLLVANPKSEGRFHSNWLSFIYPRFRIAKDLLTDDGIIFISIDENEYANLKLVGDEIFGSENLLASFSWKSEGNFDNQAKVKVIHEYILAYCKNIDSFPHPPTIDPTVDEGSKLFNSEIRNTLVKNGPKNPYSPVSLPTGFPCSFASGVIKARRTAYPHYAEDVIVNNYQLQNPTIASSGWSSKAMLTSFIEGGLKPIVDNKEQETSFYLTRTGAIEMVKQRTFKSHVVSLLTKLGNTQSTSAQLARDGVYFDYPKPVELLKYLISMNQGDDFIVLDFFAGSGTTAQAVLEANNTDQGNRKFICVQLPEPVKVDSLAAQAGFKNIAQQCVKRIKIACTAFKAKDKSEANLDFGFKVYGQVASNFNVAKSYTGSDVGQLTLGFQQATDKPLAEGWTKAGLTTEIMLLEGFPLHSYQEQKAEYTENEVVAITSDFNANTLYVCLDAQMQDDTVEALTLGPDDVLVCLDAALTDLQKVRLDDKLKLKTV
jgi:adenine-specific DNA-methyltransferase